MTITMTNGGMINGYNNYVVTGVNFRTKNNRNMPIQEIWKIFEIHI